MIISISKPRKYIKKLFGQANHFLITSLIGLDCISKETKVPPDFHTSWNPKDVDISVLRSREYILKSSLSWSIDCLDAYFIECNRVPKLIEDQEIVNELDKAGQSVFKKFECISNHINPEDKIQYEICYALVEISIQWRNNTTHLFANNPISEKSNQILNSHSQQIEELFCGLKSSQVLHNFNQKRNPSFKEVTSFIRAIHKYIAIVDEFFLKNINYERYAKDILKSFFSKNKKQINLFKTLSQERQINKIDNILSTYSFNIKDLETKILIQKILELYYDNIYGTISDHVT